MHVSTLCLGALSLKESTGYDIKKLFEAAFMHFQSASFGSIYPALKKLEQAGQVSCRVEPGERHPDRKLFSLTEAGQQALLDALASTPATEMVRSDFLVQVFFAHLLSTDTLRHKLAEMEAHYQSELAYLDAICDDPQLSAGMRYGILQGIAVYRAKLKHLQTHRDELLAHHRDQAPDQETAR